MYGVMNRRQIAYAEQSWSGVPGECQQAPGCRKKDLFIEAFQGSDGPGRRPNRQLYVRQLIINHNRPLGSSTWVKAEWGGIFCFEPFCHHPGAFCFCFWYLACWALCRRVSCRLRRLIGTLLHLSLYINMPISMYGPTYISVYICMYLPVLLIRQRGGEGKQGRQSFETKPKQKDKS